MDVDAVRTHYREAIRAYRAASDNIAADCPVVPPAAFGAGFAEQGKRIVEGLDALTRASRDFLETRSQNWEQVLLLSDEAVNADATNADAVRGVIEP